ncbi:insulinase family protein, partial [Pyxidicoccus fallax]
GKEGLAHVVEHLAFRSRHGGSPTVWTRLEAAGAGRFNAFTSLDHTVYQTLAPKESLPALLKMEGQRLSAPLAGVSAEVFAVEREVVRSELRQRNETGFIGQVFSWMHAAAYPAEHPYSRPIIGTHDTLTGLSLSDAQRFTRAHYRPDNVTLVIAGDVDLAAVEAVLRESLPESWTGSGLPLAISPRLPAQPVEPPVAPAPKTMPVYEANVATPELYLSWVLPRGFDEASALHDFVNASLTSKLWRSVMTDYDIAGIRSHLVPGTRASLLVVRVALNRGEDPERTATKVLDQVHGVWTQAIHPGALLSSEFSFQSMRRGVVTGMVLESEDLLSRAVRRAELTHFMLDARAYSRSQVALAGLNGSKVTDFAYKWLPRERARVILVRPGQNGVAGAQQAVARTPDAPSPVSSAWLVPAATAALSGPVHTLTLDNGLEVLLVPRPGMPVVRVGAALRGGTAYGAKPGLAAMAELGSFRETWFEGYPEDWGLHPGGSYQTDHLRHGLAGTAGNVGNMLAMLAEQLDTTRINYAVERAFQEQVLPHRKAVDAHPVIRAERALKSALYGTHAYAREASADEIAAVSWQEVQEWLEDVYRPVNTVVVIAGEFDVKEVEALARKYLGGWSRGGREPVAEPPEPPLPPASSRLKTVVTARPGATQGQVDVACRLPRATPEADARYSLMAELMQVDAWNRMRSESGASYGFHADTWLARAGAAHLRVSGLVDAQQVGESVKSIQDAIARFAKEIPTAELEQARSRLLAREAVSFVGSDAWVDALLTARMRGFPADSVARQPANLQAVTAEALRQEFSGCLERLTVGVTADGEQARTELQAVSVP